MRAILFDLDDTLLSNEMSVFVPRYLDSLAEYASARIEKPRLMQAVLDSTEAMIANRDPATSNYDVFWARFEPFTGFDRTRDAPFFARYYEEHFPSLESLTRPVPGAPELLERCFSAGLAVVIATNPLFPRAAIVERLRWAGVDANTAPFALITTYETMHHTKPNPDYYREILRRIDCEASAATMVGNDPLSDIEPAAAVGMRTFTVDSGIDAAPHGDLGSSGAEADDRGSLADAAAFLFS